LAGIGKSLELARGKVAGLWKEGGIAPMMSEGAKSARQTSLFEKRSGSAVFYLSGRCPIEEKQRSAARQSDRGENGKMGGEKKKKALTRAFMTEEKATHECSTFPFGIQKRSDRQPKGKV